MGIKNEQCDSTVGESVSVTVTPEEGYGEKDETLIETISRTQLEGIDTVEVGMQIQASTPEGIMIMTVLDVEDDEVTLDANHPFAGETLDFDLTVTEIRDATEEEIQHGHIHSAGEGCSDQVEGDE